jgi:hypothetical protein
MPPHKMTAALLLAASVMLAHLAVASPEIEPIEPSKEVGETGAAGVVVVDSVKGSIL